MAAQQNVINATDMNLYNTPIGNSLEESRQVLYGPCPNYDVPCNTPAVQTNIQQKLSFTDQPSPLDQTQVTQPLQMSSLESVINDIYSKLNKIDTIPQMLKSLPSIDNRLEAIENRFSRLENEMVHIKQEVQRIDDRVIGTENNTMNISYKLNMIEQERDQMKRENFELRERVIEMQSRSMRDNLLFGGIDEDVHEKDDTENKCTEAVLKDFIKTKLEIPEEIDFHVVHRLRPRPDGKPRTIVAKFERRKDRERVLRAAPEKLKNSNFSIYEQFPTEVIERRNVLWPIFKREQRNGRRVRFKEDKLYVDGRRIYPEDVQQDCSEIENLTKRQRLFPAIQEQSFLERHFGPPVGPRANPPPPSRANFVPSVNGPPPQRANFNSPPRANFGPSVNAPPQQRANFNPPPRANFGPSVSAPLPQSANFNR